MRVIVIDDNENELLDIKNKLININKNFEIETYTDLESAKLDKKQDVVVVLDVFLNNGNVIPKLNEILIENKRIKTVLISGKPRNSFDVYESYEHIYFLEKPIDEEKLEKAINIAFNKFLKNVFTFKYYKIEKGISYNDIVFFESNNRIIKIYSKDGIENFYEKLDNIEKDLPMNFIRINKSYIINLDYLLKYNNTTAYLSGENGKVYELGISKKYRSVLCTKV